jgi:hypothetical protein
VGESNYALDIFGGGGNGGEEGSKKALNIDQKN